MTHSGLCTNQCPAEDLGRNTSQRMPKLPRSLAGHRGVMMPLPGWSNMANRI